MCNSAVCSSDALLPFRSHQFAPSWFAPNTHTVLFSSSFSLSLPLILSLDSDVVPMLCRCCASAVSTYTTMDRGSQVLYQDADAAPPSAPAQYANFQGVDAQSGASGSGRQSSRGGGGGGRPLSFRPGVTSPKRKAPATATAPPATGTAPAESPDHTSAKTAMVSQQPMAHGRSRASEKPSAKAEADGPCCVPVLACYRRQTTQKGGKGKKRNKRHLAHPHGCHVVIGLWCLYRCGARDLPDRAGLVGWLVFIRLDPGQ